MLQIIYTTVPNQLEAKKLVHTLLDQQLIACANIMPNHTAIYYYEGQRCEESEVAVWCKTTEAKLNAAMQAIQSCHPYETPCILAWPANHSNAAYSQWVEASCT